MASTTNTTKQYLSYDGLSKYDELLKKHVKDNYIEQKYAEDSDIEDIVDGDEIVEDKKSLVINVKSLKYYRDLMLGKIVDTPYSVKENVPVVTINETDVELSTKSYVDQRLDWSKTLD